MSELSLTTPMRDALRTQWHEFIDLTESIRPSLYGYCRQLTSNIWEAEDLVQDTLLKSFATLATVDDPIVNPKAYILRIATNLWIDRVRRGSVVSFVNEPKEMATADNTAERLVETNEASRNLLQALPPKQLAAMLMKDIFDATLEETAAVLQISVGAVKSLLSRGRDNLERYVLAPVEQHPPPQSLVDTFVELFNREDKEGLLSLLLDDAVAGNVGTDTEWGRDGHRSPKSWLNGSLGGHPEWPKAHRFESQRAETVDYQHEPIVILYRTRNGREAMESMIRLSAADNRISEIRSYSFCPESKQAVADHIGVYVRPGAYRYPTPSPGSAFMDQ